MTNRWVQLVASVAAMAMIANLGVRLDLVARKRLTVPRFLTTTLMGWTCPHVAER